MKQVLILLSFTLLIASCSESNPGSIESVIESGDLQLIRAKKAEVLQSYDSIGKVLTQLDAAIALKDTLKTFPLVTAFTVNDTVFDHYIDIQGSVETDQNILIYPEYQGLLTRIYVKEGDRVQKGQLLAKVDDGGLSSQVAQLETQYQLAKTTFERQERLWNQKIGSEIQYLQAKSNMEGLASSVNQLKAQLGRTTVRAPFSGEIDEIITDQGQVVAPGGQALMRIINLSDMYVKASIPENYVGSIRKGTNVNITFPALNKKVSGTVKTVGNYINPNNRTFEIEVAIPNTENAVKPNLVAKLEINDYSKEDAMLIPANVIQENSQGETFVYVITDLNDDEGTAIKTQIETGPKYEGMVEVISGLNPGQIIVQAGALTLKDGAKIKIKQTPKA